MTTYQWLCVLGIPTILLTIGGLVVGFFRSQQNQIKAVRLGIQALLRAQMIADYNKWADRGYAPIYARQNFENCWEQYHLIKGPNGFMDGLRNHCMSLPTDKPEQQKAGE